MQDAQQTGTVWASTWVPGRMPLIDDGTVGYAVAWVDLADGRRVQHLVLGEAPEPGAAGRSHLEELGGLTVPVFEVDGAGR